MIHWQEMDQRMKFSLWKISAHILIRGSITVPLMISVRQDRGPPRQEL